MRIYKVLKKVSPILVIGSVKESSLKNNFSESAIDFLVHEKYIEEIKQPIWTEDDMQDYGRYCHELTVIAKPSIEAWENQKSKA